MQSCFTLFLFFSPAKSTREIILCRYFRCQLIVTGSGQFTQRMFECWDLQSTFEKMAYIFQTRSGKTNQPIKLGI